MRHSGVVCGITLLLAVSGAAQPAQPSSHDVLIRNGRVMDGSGNPWVRVDIAIAAGRIVRVGRLPDATARTIIDAHDLVVTPGFIDVHSHAAEGLSNPALRQARPLLAQGITTIVINPDGGGPVDLESQRTALETGRVGLNVAQLIGHGAVRFAVLGSADRAPSTAELDRMRALVQRAMDQGAFGLSSGLFYTPGSFATTEEVIALASVVGDVGGVYSSHVRDEGNYTVGVAASVDEVIRIAEQAKVIGIVSHMKALGPDSWGLSMALTKRIESARTRGVQVFADQYPYEASSTSLRAALLPGNAPPPSGAAESASGDPGSRDAATATVRENLRRRGGADAIQIAFSRFDPSLQGKTLAEIAVSWNTDPVTTALDLMSRGNVSIVSFNMWEQDVRQIMVQPYTMASSDGGLVLPTAGQPHPRNNGAFARRLAVYVRDRNVLGIESAIRGMTSLPASVFGMSDRGVIREGAAADIAIFDPARVQDRASYTDPHQLAEGMSYVLVNGEVVIREGQFTDALPGRVLKRRQ